MSGEKFAVFETQLMTLPIQFYPGTLDSIRQLLNNYTSCDQCVYPEYQFNDLKAFAQSLQKLFEEHEGLNKYIERELAVKHGRDFSV